DRRLHDLDDENLVRKVELELLTFIRLCHRGFAIDLVNGTAQSHGLWCLRCRNGSDKEQSNGTRACYRSDIFSHGDFSHLAPWASKCSKSPCYTYSAFTISSVIFLASPNSIMVLSR